MCKLPVMRAPAYGLEINDQFFHVRMMFLVHARAGACHDKSRNPARQRAGGRDVIFIDNTMEHPRGIHVSRAVRIHHINTMCVDAIYRTVRPHYASVLTALHDRDRTECRELL